MIRRPPRSTPLYSSAASDVYKRQECPPPIEPPSALRAVSTAAFRAVGLPRLPRRGSGGGTGASRTAAGGLLPSGGNGRDAEAGPLGVRPFLRTRRRGCPRRVEAGGRRPLDGE